MKLHRDADGQQIDWRALFPFSNHFIRDVPSTGDQQVELLLGVTHRPKHRVFLFRALLVFQTHFECLNPFRLVTMNLVDGPRHFEVPTRSEDSAAGHGLAEPFEQRLFAGFNDDKRRREHQQRELPEHNPGERALEKLKEPGVRDFESELIIQRVCRRGKKTLWLGNQTHHATVIEQARLAALHAGAVNFQQKREERFHRQQAEQNDQRACEIKIRARNFKISQSGRNGGHR